MTTTQDGTRTHDLPVTEEQLAGGATPTTSTAATSSTPGRPSGSSTR